MTRDELIDTIKEIVGHPDFAEGVCQAADIGQMFNGNDLRAIDRVACAARDEFKKTLTERVCKKCFSRHPYINIGCDLESGHEGEHRQHQKCEHPRAGGCGYYFCWSDPKLD